MILATRHRLDKEGTLPGTHRLAGCVLARGASSHLGSLLACESNTTSPRKNTAMPAPKSSPSPLPAPQLSIDHPNVPPRCSFAGLQVAEHTALTDCTEPAMKHPVLNLNRAMCNPSAIHQLVPTCTTALQCLSLGGQVQFLQCLLQRPGYFNWQQLSWLIGAGKQQQQRLSGFFCDLSVIASPERAAGQDKCRSDTTG